MDEYYCPHCNAILNYQKGFDPNNATWVCTGCGETLYGDELKYEGENYPGVIWKCDKCDALLNIQPGFSDLNNYWTCTECGHLNSISADDIYSSEEEYQNTIYKDDYDEDSSDFSLRNPERKYYCESCGDLLNRQKDFSDWGVYYTCKKCGFWNDITVEEKTTDGESNNDYNSESDYSSDDDYGSDDDYDSDDDTSSDDDYGSDYNYILNSSYSSNLSGYSYSSGYSNISWKKYWQIICAFILGPIMALSLLYLKVLPPLNFRVDNKTIPILTIIGEVLGCIALCFVILYLFKLIVVFIIKHWKFFLTILLIAAAIFTAWRVYRYNQKTAIIPMSSWEAINKNYKEIYEQFEIAGFTKIEINELDDLLSDTIKKDGLVESISIDGNSTFNKNGQSSAHAKVVINYHSILESRCPISSKEAKGEDYKEVKQKFEDAGFTNVTVEEDRDLRFGLFSEENEVKEIIIGEDNKKFDYGDRFVQDISIVIRYHAYKK